jgi:hypothetical protein
MAMSQSEYLRRIVESTPNYVSRSKVRDSSEYTGIQRARAAATYIPAKVANTIERNGCAASVVQTGKGVNMEYGGVLLKAQGCAICADSRPFPTADAARGIVIPTPCYDRRKPPFSQQDLSGNPYTPACTPGANSYPNRTAAVGGRCIYIEDGSINMNGVYPSG